MLKHNEVNPLAVFGMRRLEHCPPHFTSVSFDLYVNEKVITDWVWENLEGRFYFGGEYITDSELPKLTMHQLIAFEIASEASYFSLLLPTLNKTQDW